MRYAIVIGIDEYGEDGMRLSGAVSDACTFRDWVLDPDGGNVPKDKLRLLLSRRRDDPGPDGAVPPATKDNIVTAINDVVVAAEGQPVERLYFYFSGHGITARVANRDESALVMPGFDALHTDHSLAVRSIAEYFETTAFADQLIFIDACRNIPWTDREFEIGRWPVPRRRDPGAQPVQQFILYATSPGRTAEEVGFPGEAAGAFTSTLLEALGGTGNAKAWSWERNCYEVRWERLASFVHDRMQAAKAADPDSVQIPQDTGARGVAGRDRDVPVVSFPSGHFPALQLTIDLEADAVYDSAEVSVLDALGEPVSRVLGLTGQSHTFQLAPKTYAVRAATTAPAALMGSLKAPIELYENRTERIGLRPGASASGGQRTTESIGPEDMVLPRANPVRGTITVHSPDLLAMAEIRDEAGAIFALTPPGLDNAAKPGFYNIREIGPETTKDAKFVVLGPGEREDVELPPQRLDAFVASLAKALGGDVRGGYAYMPGRDQPITWALPSTIVAAAVIGDLNGQSHAAMGVGDIRQTLDRATSGVALFAAGTSPNDEALSKLRVRIWPTGQPVGPDDVAVKPSAAGVAGLVLPVRESGPHWAALTVGDGAPTVLAFPVLRGRLATLVAQVEPNRIRLFQYHLAIKPDAAHAVDDVIGSERLQRMLLAGRVDSAEALARKVAKAAERDPFAGLVVGYILLRLGQHHDVGALASTVLAAGPGLSDAYVLRGEYEANEGRPQAAAQAFAEAIGTGVPAFGEGLTRLVEGLRVSGLVDPRTALVRHIFQRHVRGSMWAAFTPRRGLEPGRPVISAGDLGFEA